MAIIVVHGTMTVRSARASSWWQSSWDQHGALGAMKRAMNECGYEDDIWKAGGTDVSEIATLAHDKRNMFTRNGRFYWSGFNQKQFREDGGEQLARYLNHIYEYAPNEAIRIIAHSHGANVVKVCTSSNILDPSVHISQICFLACPHFHIPGKKAPFPYRLDPERVSQIVNLYTADDTVQDGIAGLLPNMFGVDFWPRDAHRTDPDPATNGIYQDFHIDTEDSGSSAHTAMHGAHLFYMIGLWFCGDARFDDILSSNNRLLPIPKGDFGK